MESATRSPAHSGKLLAAFLLPHPLLDVAAAADTAEVRSTKTRRNKTWLLRWLPVYLWRWGALFLVFWLTSTLAPLLALPPALIWALDLAQVLSAGVALWLVTLYVNCRLEPF